MSIFENMNARQIAMCLSAFYEDAKEWKGPRVSLMSTQIRLPNKDQPITLFRSDFDEGIKILREDYDVFWTPDTKPDDLTWKINKRLVKELDDRIRKNTYIDTDSVCGRMVFGPGCVVMGNDYLYRRELGLPDNATVADILERIKELKNENSKLNDDVDCLKENLGVTERALKTVKQDEQKLEEAVKDISRELFFFDNATVADILEKIRRLMDENCILNSKVLKLEDADKLRRHWHSKYEEEHKECVRLSKLHAALKKRIRSMEAEAAEKETKNKVITDTLRDNLVDSVEECKKLNGRIHDLEALVLNLTHDDKEDE